MSSSRQATSAASAGAETSWERRSIAVPSARNISPTFSVVEYASRRLRSLVTEAWRMPYVADTAPSATTTNPHQAGPSGSRRNATSSAPYTPILTIAALITAETWLGAAGWARGNQTWNGTAPALVANPAISSAKAIDAWRDLGSTALMASKPVPPPSAASTVKPSSSSPKLRWVIAAYQSAADRTSSRSRCSVSTSTVEASAISSHISRNETASAAAGTSCIETRNAGSATQEVREAAGPCA